MTQFSAPTGQTLELLGHVGRVQGRAARFGEHQPGLHGGFDDERGVDWLILGAWVAEDRAGQAESGSPALAS
jgi:hypothetical protein